MGKYLNYPQPEKFPLAVRLQVREPGQEPVVEDEIRRHEFSELILVVRGRAEHRIGTRYFPLEEGDVLIVHPGTTDAFSNLSDFEILVVIFDSSAPLPVLEGANLPLIEVLYPHASVQLDSLKPVLRIPVNDRALCENLVRRLSYETHRKRLGRNILIPLIFTELIVYLARGDSVEEEKELPWLVQPAVEYLNAHFREALDLKRLTQISGMSERSLYRHFQKAIGMSPNRYLWTIRVQKVCELLKQTHCGIGEIALRCGFCDGNHLSKVFRAVTGTTPFLFRRECRAQTVSELRDFRKNSPLPGIDSEKSI